MAPEFNGDVSAFTIIGSTLYVGGSFTAVGGATRGRLAALDGATGALKTWAPMADNTVNALTPTPDKKRVIAGGRFYRVNDAKGRGLVALDAKTAVRTTWVINQVVKDYGKKSGILTLATDATTVYGGGFAYGGGNFEGVFAADPKRGEVKWLADCHGDTYGVQPVGSIIYLVSHAHTCENIGGWPETKPVQTVRRTMALTRAAQGTILSQTQPGPHYGDFTGYHAPSIYNWFPILEPGTFTDTGQAAWSIVGNSSYLALGGEFIAANGVPQQGLVRFADPVEGAHGDGADAVRPRLAADRGERRHLRDRRELADQHRRRRRQAALRSAA